MTSRLSSDNLLLPEPRVSADDSTKHKARAIIDQLPDSASWDDVMYELYVREAIDAGLADVAADRSLSTADLRQRLEQRLRRAS